MAHRFSWELHRGPVAPGLCVLHACDNPPCVNPDHLFVGTKKDNAVDREAKGRHQPCSGEANSRAKLTAAQVEEIRLRAGERQVDLAREFGVPRGTIWKIVHGKRWANAH